MRKAPLSDENVFDVVQIGYGPVSQVLALMLARAGHRVAVVERYSEPYVLPRAVCIDHEAARILRAIGLGEGLDRVSQPGPLYQWFNAEWEELLCIDWTKGSVSGGPEVNFVHQPSLEAEFRAKIPELPNVELNLGWELNGFAEQGDHVEVRVAKVGTGEARSLRARYLIGADGANSLVRETLGIGQEDRGFRADWLIADMELHPGVTLDIQECGQYCNPERPTTIVPGGMHDGRVCRPVGVHATARRDAGGAARQGERLALADALGAVRPGGPGPACDLHVSLTGRGYLAARPRAARG